MGSWLAGGGGGGGGGGGWRGPLCDPAASPMGGVCGEASFCQCIGGRVTNDGMMSDCIPLRGPPDLTLFGELGSSTVAHAGQHTLSETTRRIELDRGGGG